MRELFSPDRRDLLVGASCFAGAALAGSAPLWSVPRALPPGGLNALVPKRIGDWVLTGIEGVVVSEGGEQARGPYDDLLTRIYSAPSAPPVTLLIAYIGSQRADVRLHRPEACYPAAGFALSEGEVVGVRLRGLPTIPAQLLLARSASRTEHLLYWTRVGSDFPTSNVAQLGAFVRANLAGSVPDAVLVRLSVPGSDRQLAWRVMQTFLEALLAASSSLAVQTLFGGPRHAAPPPVPRNGAST